MGDVNRRLSKGKAKATSDGSTSRGHGSRGRHSVSSFPTVPDHLIGDAMTDEEFNQIYSGRGDANLPTLDSLFEDVDEAGLDNLDGDDEPTPQSNDVDVEAGRDLSRSGQSIVGGLLAKKGKRAQSSTSSSGTTVSSHNELAMYQGVPCDYDDDDVDFDVLGWWKRNEHMFPCLGMLARQVLSVPVSTVAVEREFSAGGNILTDYRSCLNSESLETLVCNQDWLLARRRAQESSGGGGAKPAGPVPEPPVREPEPVPAGTVYYPVTRGGGTGTGGSGTGTVPCPPLLPPPVASNSNPSLSPINTPPTHLISSLLSFVSLDLPGLLCLSSFPPSPGNSCPGACPLNQLPGRFNTKVLSWDRWEERLGSLGYLALDSGPVFKESSRVTKKVLAEGGIIFPLRPLLVEICNKFNLLPGELTPNAHRFLNCFVNICESLNIKPSLDLFLHMYDVLPGTSNCPGFVYFHSRANSRGFITGLPPSHKKWKQRFVFVEFPPDQFPLSHCEWADRVMKPERVHPEPTKELEDACEKLLKGDPVTGKPYAYGGWVYRL
ncbi:hypothetical protein DM860_001373 [Cuscuta australis]|uniref:Uncharacterized protein n=1 Tax=Cuscuta australis TaxID=267555 RepID=A0A328E861_9ASTE|nr:hypothetical protein DM860_001373 [Cuscuta australis]